jgi:hypothetical protein
LLCAAAPFFAIGAAVASDPAPVVFGALYNLSGSQAVLDVPSLSALYDTARLIVAAMAKAGDTDPPAGGPRRVQQSGCRLVCFDPWG